MDRGHLSYIGPCLLTSNVETLLYTTGVLLPNDNVSMSVGHLDHVLFSKTASRCVTYIKTLSLGNNTSVVWTKKFLHY